MKITHKHMLTPWRACRFGVQEFRAVFPLTERRRGVEINAENIQRAFDSGLHDEVAWLLAVLWGKAGDASIDPKKFDPEGHIHRVVMSDLALFRDWHRHLTDALVTLARNLDELGFTLVNGRLMCSGDSR